MKNREKPRENDNHTEMLLIPSIPEDPIMGLTSTNKAAAILLAEKKKDLDD